VNGDRGHAAVYRVGEARRDVEVAMNWWVGTAAAAFALVLAGCAGGAGAGVRRGEGPVLGAPGFGDLGLVVDALRGLDGELIVHVRIEPRPDSPDCFTDDGSVRVEVDGVPLELDRPGGHVRPTMIAGNTVVTRRCVGASYRLPAGAALPLSDTSRVEVSQGPRRGAFTVQRLRGERGLVVVGSAPFEPGDRVALQVTPSSVVWSGDPARVAVAIRDAVGGRTSVGSVSVSPPSFTFAWPAGVIDPTAVELTLGDLYAHPAPVECRGFAWCETAGAAGTLIAPL
jgi:hypothetical protein